jgi:hypothetical protein
MITNKKVDISKNQNPRQPTKNAKQKPIPKERMSEKLNATHSNAEGEWVKQSRSNQKTGGKTTKATNQKTVLWANR